MPPNRGPAPVKLYRKDDAEVLILGPITCYVFEDGSHTDNRVGAVLLMIPPGVSGPPMHWHRFHDELFFVTKGALTYTSLPFLRDMAGYLGLLLK